MRFGLVLQLPCGRWRCGQPNGGWELAAVPGQQRPEVFQIRGARGLGKPLEWQVQLSANEARDRCVRSAEAGASEQRRPVLRSHVHGHVLAEQAPEVQRCQSTVGAGSFGVEPPTPEGRFVTEEHPDIARLQQPGGSSRHQQKMDAQPPRQAGQGDIQVRRRGVPHKHRLLDAAASRHRIRNLTEHCSHHQRVRPTAPQSQQVHILCQCVLQGSADPGWQQ